MRFLVALFNRLFGRSKHVRGENVAHLPGERARIKDTGMTAQQMAWRKVGAEVGDRRLAEKPTRSSEFERLLRK
ncbi:hypothetical protein SAMN05444007_108195 [Cribrihabitans marinus]|uniref:Uncharacterized protein n=1 Tax=Cribrihabitans marinus TaxID=1227549 RepID=A0A1H7CLD8_9RHOB|nr:hypothetical protein [Cribrihabitans marinus]GGH35970.1 hypothetical protein GCM10010973_29640 [Cribrihabitans marinus]SEJ90583.1 hypothetical protein SAMN05444007_108195 [Cribrihabitans marinus]